MKVVTLDMRVIPVMWSSVGRTLHLLKNSSVSASTTSSLVSSPPALMAPTTSECCMPITDTPFTWERRGEGREFYIDLTLGTFDLFLVCLIHDL